MCTYTHAHVNAYACAHYKSNGHLEIHIFDTPHPIHAKKNVSKTRVHVEKHVHMNACARKHANFDLPQISVHNIYVSQKLRKLVGACAKMHMHAKNIRMCMRIHMVHLFLAPLVLEFRAPSNCGVDLFCVMNNEQVRGFGACCWKCMRPCTHVHAACMG